jgi:D-glycero-alpha-D-manno-heptose-7-phosphate kinase
MIMTRTPLRISLGGGGTDLPSYYREFGGFVISAAINKYVCIAINKSFLPGYFLRYTDNERIENYEEIVHPLLREALKMHEVPSPLEIVSIADVPGGTGLGSSGAFLVGLIHALYAYERKRVTAETLAQEAVEIEMNRLLEPVGKQDQYIAAYGGLLCQEYRPDDSVDLTVLKISETALRELRDSLMLFFLGETRKASTLLDDQRTRSEQGNKTMLESLHFSKQLGREIHSVLTSDAVYEFGPLMHQHWLRKRCRSKGMTNDRVDELYEIALNRGGSTGGKLVGAGGNGFLLLQTNDRKRLRAAMADAGVTEMEFNFDFDGSAVMMRNA